MKNCLIYATIREPIMIKNVKLKAHKKRFAQKLIFILFQISIFPSIIYLDLNNSLNAQTNTAVGVAKATEALIKIYDPSVVNVKLIVPAYANTPTACGGLSNNGEWEAYYCRNDQTILISQNNLKLIEQKYGLEAIATLVAHEFAHGRQHSTTGFSGDLMWTVVFDELQADCIAGVYMREATPIKLSEAQIERSKKFLGSIGDYSPQERDWHGTPEMRSLAFSQGYKNGSLSSCLASKDRNWRKSLDNLPKNLDKLIDKGLDFLNRF